MEQTSDDETIPAPVSLGGPRGAGGPALGADPTFELQQAYLHGRRRLVGLARTVLADADGAEEVVQEAFVRTLARWSDVRDRDDPLPYLRSVVLNLCRARFRRKATPSRRLDVVPSAEHHASVSARREAVVAALATLPVRQREVVALRFFGELSTAETADALGISPGTVKTHLHRAMVALGPRLEEHRHD
jgi:RNA polymerase sigma-70 factor (sigma-E family)